MPTIRSAMPQDQTRLLEMIHALAKYHDDPPACTSDALLRDVFSDDPFLHVLVAERSGPAENTGLLGYAALTRSAQLQRGLRGLDMHHLYVDSSARDEGIGAALVAATQTHAQALGCAYVTVGTHPDNVSAQAFYAAQGFQRRDANGPRFVWRNLRIG